MEQLGHEVWTGAWWGNRSSTVDNLVNVVLNRHDMMREEMVLVEQGFYQKCAELLGVPDTYSPRIYTRITRWNNRMAGNGRFEGFGLIRLISGSHVHIALRHPIAASKWFKNPEEALEWLETNVKPLVSKAS